MKKALLPLLALATLIGAGTKNTSLSPLFVKAEDADASKIGEEASGDGIYSFEEEGGWTFSEEGSASYSEEESCDGSKSLHVVRSSTDSYFTAKNNVPFLIEAGKRYRLGFYYKSQHSYGVSISMNAEIYDESGSLLRTIEGGGMKLNADSLSKGWSEFFIEFRADNAATSVKMAIIIKYGAADVYLDKATCSLTGDDVYDETFSLPKSDGTLLNWDFARATVEEGVLALRNGGEAKASWNRFLSGYGYTFTFDAKGKPSSKGKIRFEIFDSSGTLTQSSEEEFPLSDELSQKSVEITIKRGCKGYIAFVNDTGSPIYIDNVHAVKSYSPNDESGWTGQWVTYPDSDVTADAAYQNRWYRKKFTIPENIASASLQVTADDVRYPYVNGVSFGYSGTWATPTVVDITSSLVKGDNVFACRVYNGSYYSGLLFEITVITEGGRTLTFASDTETLSSKTAGPISGMNLSNEDLSWTAVDYDDSEWVHCYVIGQVGCMPWGSIPFISAASTCPELEVLGVELPNQIELGSTLSFSITWKPKAKIEKPISISASFWGKYSSDFDEADPAKTMLRQVSGPDMTSWEAGQEASIGYEADVPDFIDPGSYMLQLDPDSVSIVGNPDYSNNKLRGHYVNFLKTDIEIEKTCVVMENGFTKLEIGEQSYAPYIFMQSDGLKYVKASYLSNLYNSGMRLFSVGNNKVVDSITNESTWTGDGAYNFTPFDNTIYTTLSGAPKAKLLVMVSCDPPSWWLNKYPEERALSAKGGTDSVSYASKKWVKDVSAYLRAVLEHMKSMPYASHVFAVKFAQGSTYEWQEYGMELGNCADFSKVAQSAWREYLRLTYKTNSALQKAWGDGSVTFDNANIPGYGERESSTYTSLLDGVIQRSVLDYQDFKAYNVTNSILSFSKVVKEVSDGNWLAGTYQGYITNALTYESSGIANNAFARLLEKDSPCDFFCGPVSYNTRQSGYSDTPMQAASSIVAAGKLCLVEFDERTVKVDMPDQSPLTMDEWGKTYTLEDTLSLMKRDAGNSLISGFGSWIYDMTGGWYDDGEIYNLVSLIMEEWSYALQHQQNENNREVAFIIEDKMPSDYAYNFGGSYSALEVNLGRQKEDLAVIGAGYDTYLASEFKKGLPKDYKFYIVVGNRFDAETIEGINKECKVNGKAVLWIGTPGIYGEDGSMSPSNVSSLIDMDVTFASESVYTGVSIDSDCEDPLVSGASGLTYGKPEIMEVSPVAAVIDSDAVTLGHIKNGSRVGLAYKEVAVSGGSYLSVFSSVGHVPAQVLRNIMKKVGVHIYDESFSDVVFSSSGYLCIDSPYGGERTISLPKKYDVYDVYNKKLIAANVDKFDVTLEAKGTRLFRLMEANSYGKDGPTPAPTPTPTPTPTAPSMGLDVIPGITLICLGGLITVAMGVVLTIAIYDRKTSKVRKE